MAQSGHSLAGPIAGILFVCSHLLHNVIKRQEKRKLEGKTRVGAPACKPAL
jgi:hypothetical protein